MPTIKLDEKILNPDFETFAQIQDEKTEKERDLTIKDILTISCRLDKQEVAVQQAQKGTVDTERRMKRFFLLKKLNKANGSMDVDSDELKDLVDFVKTNPNLDVITLGQTVEILDGPTKLKSVKK